MTTKCPRLVSVRNAKEHRPIVLASLYGHKDLVRYLYNHTLLSDLDPCDESDEHKGKNGAMLVTNCIVNGLYGIALDLIQRYPKLAYTRDSDNDTAIIALAQTPCAWPSVPHIRKVYKLKLGHAQAKEILNCICQEIPHFDATQQKNAGLNQALFKAEVMKHYPDIVWFKDSYGLNLFFYAVSHRQEKIFSLIYKMGAKKNILATAWDKLHTNMLHHATKIFMSYCEEVERLVQPKHRKMVNLKQKKTPQALFKDQHKELVDQGEKWMKDTATSCTVVAALINDVLLRLYYAISLFTSYMSLLMFLGILKSRYREEDFLRSLPTKQIVGLATLFLSMTTMMVSFVVTLMTLVRGRTPWVSAQFMVLAVVPIGMFGVLQFPVLLEIFCSTYFPRVFDKPRESRRVSKLFWRK
ncbi:hypothetical protein Bca52824_066157 [Brassica carinata]|uniref:PGG domain-containing protein n=3 Tax=Brassica TaxID=3705 RepID=A0A8X7QLE8_BRACI|nr:hypothetical protein Bca52824_066157 [Brassica carinata]